MYLNLVLYLIRWRIQVGMTLEKRLLAESIATAVRLAERVLKAT
jgi:hypothetical protein